MFSVLKTNDRGLCAIFHFEEGKFHALLPIKIFDFLVLEKDVALWGKCHTYLTKYTFIKGDWFFGTFYAHFWGGGLFFSSNIERLSFYIILHSNVHMAILNLFTS